LPSRTGAKLRVALPSVFSSEALAWLA